MALLKPLGLLRPLGLLGLLGLLVGACSSGGFMESLGKKLPKVPEFGRSVSMGPAGFLGAVVVDEPRAAIVGRDILSSGGSAADAAAAIAFALSVTLPGTASLGGGGVCMIHDGQRGKTEVLDFLPRAPTRVLPQSSRPTAIPGTVRGIKVLHSRFGRLSWARIMAPAESLARFGIPVSRSLARSLKPVEYALLQDIETRRVLGRDEGQRMVTEGDMLVQVDLASLLSRLRRQGPETFYKGTMGRQFVAAVADAGGSLSRADLMRYKVRRSPTIKIPFGNKIAHFAPPPAAGGAMAGIMWAMMTGDGRYGKTTGVSRRHLLAEVAMRAFADRGQWMRSDGFSTVAADQLVSASRLAPLMKSFNPERHVRAADLSPPPVERPENPSATGFIVIDRYGSAVTCGLTLNNPFGTGRMARGMGLVLAALPDQSGRGSISLGPMMVLGREDKQFYFASTATGGVVAPTAMTSVALRLLVGGDSMEKAMSAKRVHHGGMPDRTYYEHGLDRSIVKGLEDRGHDMSPTPVLGLVSVASCPGGLPDKPLTCVVGSDPRGSGAVATAPQ